MKIGKTLCGVTGLVLALAAAPALQAQPGGGPMGRGFGAGGRFGGFRMSAPVTGAPYSATRTISQVQKLEDGATITHTTTVKEARDSNGRTYRETLREGGPHSFTEFSVFDPVNRVSIHWTSNTKQASLMHLPDAGEAQSRWARGPQGDAAMGPKAGAMHAHGNFQPANVESLGSKTISGVTTDGTRSTRIIPAGAQGNDQPLTISHESWVSSELKIEVMRTDSDPRNGTRTMEVTHIDRGEPAASLFQAPAGYTVQEHTRGQRNSSFDAAP